MTTSTIQFDTNGESQVLVATQDIRNSEHENATIATGQRVFFRRPERSHDERIILAYESGEPTNGNQYAEWASISDAQGFADRVGLSEAEIR